MLAENRGVSGEESLGEVLRFPPQDHWWSTGDEEKSTKSPLRSSQPPPSKDRQGSRIIISRRGD